MLGLRVCGLKVKGASRAGSLLTSIFACVPSVGGGVATAVLGAVSSDGFASYGRAVDAKQRLIGRRYTREGHLHLGVQGGAVLNQTFVQTYLASASLGYHFNELHGVRLEGHFGFSRDTEERCSVESAYADTTQSYFSACDKARQQGLSSPEDSQNYDADGIYSPAYMPIRQVDSMLSLNYTLTPAYGKSMWFISQVVHLDFFLTIGAGVTQSTYWKKLNYEDQFGSLAEAQTEGSVLCRDLKRNVTKRCIDFKEEGGHEAHFDGNMPKIDSVRFKSTSKQTIKGDLSKVGKRGRPEPEEQLSPTFNVGLGTRVYFLERFLMNLELKNYTILGDDGKGGNDIGNIFVLSSGVSLLL